MGNTNFQTIHQMGTAISNMVKQATGRDDVQNIDMEHITVAQNHHYEEIDLSGQVVSFQAGEAGLPFEKLAVQINPVQDLHGYDKPWPAGGGKNLFDKDAAEIGKWLNVSTGAIENTSTNYALSDYIPVKAGFPYVITNTQSSRIWFYDSEKNPVEIIASNPYTPPSDGFVIFTIAILSADINTVQFEQGTTLSSYTPYSNICPITGWTMVNLYQAGENMEDARVYRFTFPSEAGTVYGGTLDVLTGELTVDSYEYVFTGNEPWNASSTPHRFSTTIGSYLPEAIATQKMITGAQQNVISSVFGRAIYENADGVAYVVHQTGGALYVVNETSANTVSDISNIMKNSQLVYELATPLAYHLTPQEITTLLGQNYIWADTGDIEVKFTNVKEMY